jgi:hypothetical protein
MFKEFKVFGGLTPSSMVELLHSGIATFIQLYYFNRNPFIRHLLIG